MSDQLVLAVAATIVVVICVWGIYGDGGWSHKISWLGLLVQILQKHCRCPFCDGTTGKWKSKGFFIYHEPCKHEFIRLIFFPGFPILRFCWGAVKCEDWFESADSTDKPDEKAVSLTRRQSA